MAGKWDAEADVVIVGFGGAGACAAIEAADRGREVLVVDRFTGGGATAISGGIVYAGGGTSHQVTAGVTDSEEAMFAYLRLEVGDAVSEATLKRFCAQSVDNLRWLESNGVPFDASLAPRKTSYPTNDHYLYYSGNELAPPYRDQAPPAPRGHRTHGAGMSGRTLFAALRKAVARRPITVRCQTAASRLLTDSAGRVIGVECREISGPFARWAHRTMSRWNRKLNIYYRPAGRKLDRPIRRIEAKHAVVRRFLARSGVILAAGGFVFNRTMIAEHAPAYKGGSSLGTLGDDGAGIRLGTEAGGVADRLHRVSAWRFFNPPLALVDGVLVNPEGERVCNETLYGARIGDHIAQQTKSRSYLIVDQRILDDAKRQLRSQTLWFQWTQMKYLFLFGHAKSATIDELAHEIEVDNDRLRYTIQTYNSDARAGRPDAMGKDADHVRPLETGPYYAFDCSLRTQPGFPCPIITLGGLAVQEETGAVLREDASEIPGLFAAGRNAIGVCSESYVSGLAIADCVFSGRRAGATVAARSQEPA